MSAKAKYKSASEMVPRVIIHPELHSILFRQRADTGKPISRKVHEILCEALERTDLMDAALPKQVSSTTGSL